MSASGSEHSTDALEKLDEAVGRALGRVRELQSRVKSAEARSSELEAMLKRFTSDEAEPARLIERMHRLEEENGEMRSRLDEGRGAVERLLARVRFLEEKR